MNGLFPLWPNGITIALSLMLAFDPSFHLLVCLIESKRDENIRGSK
jgi:hypothetical protein